MFLDSASVRNRFPYFSPLPNMTGRLETQSAGLINPRKLIRAQIQLAVESGCRLVRSVVSEIARDPPAEMWTIRTRDSGTILARKILFCPGAFLFHLEKRPEKLGRIDVRPRTTVAARIRIDDDVLRRKLVAGMPNVTFRAWRDFGQNRGLPFYMLAPVQYPDGTSMKKEPQKLFFSNLRFS